MTLRTAPAPPRRRRPGWAVAIAVGAVAMLGVLGVGARWMFDDHALQGYGDGSGGPVAVGETIYASLPDLPNDVGPRGSRRLDLRSVSPRVTSNTSDATVVVLSCVATPGGDQLIGGGSAKNAESYCSSLRPFRPGPVDVGATTTGLVLAITARHAGVVRIDGADIRYREGWRWGHQHVGYHMAFTTP